MIALLKKILGIAPGVDFGNVMAKGAVIIDVRSPREYEDGHIRGSLNIPVANLQEQLSKLNKEKPVITCCASGMRAGSARAKLLANGFKEVYNGGSWQRLKKFEQ